MCAKSDILLLFQVPSRCLLKEKCIIRWVHCQKGQKSREKLFLAVSSVSGKQFLHLGVLPYVQASDKVSQKFIVLVIITCQHKSCIYSSILQFRYYKIDFFGRNKKVLFKNYNFPDCMQKLYAKVQN